MKHTKSKKSKRLSLRKLIKGGFQNAGSPASEHVNTLLKADCAPLNIGSITPETGTDVSNVNIWKTTGGGYKKKRKKSKKRKNKNKNKNKNKRRKKSYKKNKRSVKK